jgi:hypothetical protein
MIETLFPPLGGETKNSLEKFLTLIDRTFPLQKRYAAVLPKNIAELSRLLTKNRGERRGGYMGEAALLGAYLRYFLPWNVFRLSRLLPALFPAGGAAPDKKTIVDFGSGPLTLPLALWINFPQIRDSDIRFFCVDQNGAALDAGKKLFLALAGENSGWTIKTIRSTLGAKIAAPGADLVCALNVCNELVQNIDQGDTSKLSERAKHFSFFLEKHLSAAGKILIMEPGVPRSAQFLHYVRNYLLEKNFFIKAPCPSAGRCSMPGGRKGQKWCHFTFGTEDAPLPLHKLSALAGLPKEKATLSFLFAEKPSAPAEKNQTEKTPPPKSHLNIRVISDSFPLEENRWGRYACSEKELTLLRGEKKSIEKYVSGDFIQTAFPQKDSRDKKSGALIVDISS